MILKRILIILVIILNSLITLYGQGKNDSTGKSFLWEVDSTLGKSYILGSVHLLKKEHYPLKNAIEEAFKRTEALAVEADISAEKMAEGMMIMMQKGMYKGEETLKDNISEKTYQLAQEKLKELGMDIEGFRKFKPWMLAMTISSMELMKLGFNPNYGIEKYFLEKASGKKEILELEGLEYQANLFESLTEGENDKFLLSTIMEVNQLEKEIENIVKAWITGDTARMEQILTKYIQKYPDLKDLYKKILDGRNEKMVDKISSYLKTGKKYFVIVGAAHMVGEKGIIRLLKNKGFSIRQL